MKTCLFTNGNKANVSLLSRGTGRPPALPLCPQFTFSHRLRAALNLIIGLNRCNFASDQLHEDTTVGLQVCNPTELLHFSSWSWSLTHPWILWPALWLCGMVRTTGIFPGWTGYFPREISCEFEGKILLAHLFAMPVVLGDAVKQPVSHCQVSYSSYGITDIRHDDCTSFVDKLCT